jgi:multidrug efflux system membrane fusion protein
MTHARSPRSHAHSIASLAAPLALLALGLAGCSAEQAAAPAPTFPVTVGEVTRADVPVTWRGVGSVEAMSSVAVKSLVGGELTRVHFTEGDDVTRGQLLFTIDPRPYRAALAAAEAQLARDRALAANAAADAQRYADLATKEYVTAEELDAKRSNAAALEASVKADQAAVEKARLDLGYCEIRSPIDGRTGSLQVYAGNVVKANDVPLLVIQQVTPIRVDFAVPQQLLAEIRKRSAAGELPVRVAPPAAGAGAADAVDAQAGDEAPTPASDADPGTPATASAAAAPGETGRLTFVDNQVDAASGTIGLKATFDNADRALWPGEFVEVTLTLSTLSGAVVAPSAAVQVGQDGTYVYVVRPDQTVEMRTVAAGQIVDGRTVITSGLSGGETVVTDGQLRLYPGAKVDILAPGAAADAR